MTFSDADRSKIHELNLRARDQGLDDYQAASDFLNQPVRVADPESARPLVPQPPTDLELLDAIDQNTASTLADSPQFSRIMDLVHQSPPQAATMLLFLMKAGKIDQTNADKLRTLLDRKIPDPNWTPAIHESPSPWAETFGNRDFTLDSGDTVSGRCFPEFIRAVEEG